jgi:D-alanyl-D-alanine dipeptidase
MAEEELKPVLAWMDPGKKPILVQLPEGQYKRLKKRWRLPKVPTG